MLYGLGPFLADNMGRLFQKGKEKSLAYFE